MRRPNFDRITASLRALQYQPVKPIAPVTAEISPEVKKTTPKKKKTSKPRAEEREDDLLFDDGDIEDVLW